MAIKVENSVVGLEYELTEEGTTEVIDSNKDAQPLEFIMGKGMLIPGLESQLVDMKEGDSATISVKAADAYGEINDEAKQTLPRDQFEGVELAEGMMLYGQGEDGQQIQVVVDAFTDTEVTVNFNHPLAGKDLSFAVTILSERDATDEEIESGQVGGAHCEDGSCGCGD